MEKNIKDNDKFIYNIKIITIIIITTIISIIIKNLINIYYNE